LHTGVRHIVSGRLVGWSLIVVNPGEESHAWQEGTIVDPDHRGHRLGWIVKIENQRQLRRYRPMVRFVHTWNAETNKFMIDINEAVGYRPVNRYIAYQKKIA
ncbi:MAG: GNAT family N-acetyltransferase, partial [Stackebrandtia sp.]